MEAEKTMEDYQAEQEKKDAKREELKRTVKFVLFSISAGAIELGTFTVMLYGNSR